MQEFVSRKNIERYRLLLAGTSLDPAARKEIEKLLSEELAKLEPVEIVMWDTDSEGSTIFHPLVTHETAMLLGGMCGLRLSLGPYDGHPKMIARAVQLKLTPDQAQALARDIQHLSDWTQLPLEERKRRANLPALQGEDSARELEARRGPQEAGRNSRNEGQGSQLTPNAQLGLSEPRSSVAPLEKPSADLAKASFLRDKAARALELANGLSDADKARLKRLSQELREQATELEHQAAAETPNRSPERGRDRKTVQGPRKKGGRSNDPEPQI